MSDSTWTLPGPARFVEDIVADLRAGNNILIALPETYDDEIFAAMKAVEATGGDVLSWDRLKVGAHPQGHAPLNLLYETFAPDAESDAIRSVEALARLDGFLSRGIWLDDIPDKAWPAWIDFLQSYGYICGNVPEYERTLFVVPLRGQRAIKQMPTAANIKVHTFYDIMRELDMHFFISEQLLNSDYTMLEERIARAIIVNLALWDTELAQRLIELPLETLLAPRAVLDAYAEERGWNNDDDDPAWHRGTKMRIAGVERVHSALLRGKAGQQELSRRIWRAQASVLLPFIEEQRQRIIYALHEHLTVPFETEYGQMINNMYELEIGHIYSQIRTNYQVESAQREKVDLLRDMRNGLSHLNVIPAETLRLYQHIDPQRVDTQRPVLD